MTVSKRISRVYHDWLHSRSAPRIFSAGTSLGSSVAPIFIIGHYRSGTTLLRYVLDSHSNIAIPPETDFLIHLRSMWADGMAMEGLRDMGFDASHVVERQRDFARYFYENYAASRSKPRWGDKSPSYVDILDYLVIAFPDAQFVHIFRHPLDQVHSFTAGGTRPMVQIPVTDAELAHPVDIRVDAARLWVAQAEKQLLQLRNHRDRCTAILYSELTDDPNRTARSILDFLGEEWEDSVLEFQDAPHDRGRQDNKIRDTVGFANSSGGYLRWPVPLQNECERITAQTWKLVQGRVVQSRPVD